MESSSLKISVVTVSYNAVDSIEETILSVINQTYDNIEYIIIDGGSTDGTVEIIQKYSDRIAYWISEPDKGIYDAMNKGIEIATGDYLFFLGSDDLLNNGILSNINWDGFPSGGVIYGDIKYRMSGKIVVGKTSNWRITHSNIPHQAVFYSKDIFQIFGLRYDCKYKSYADYVLNLQCWKNKKIKFNYIPEIIAIYNETGFSSAGIDPEFEKDSLHIFFESTPSYLMPLVIARKVIGKLFRKK